MLKWLLPYRDNEYKKSEGSDAAAAAAAAATAAAAALTRGLG
jgi:hypothetical protein